VPAPSSVDSLSLRQLPLLTLYLTDRCNSRCITCDHWRHGRTDVSVAAVKRLLPALERLRTQTVLISGGEPLLHPQWQEIADLLRTNGHELWLLTAGLALAKQARRAASAFHHITVSLDGADAATYAAIRGLDAFDKVCEGIRAVADLGAAPGLRVTLQRANFRQLPDLVALARKLGARSISFLTVDVANAHAFARSGEVAGGLALLPDELQEFERLIEQLERAHAADFDSGFIEEPAAKLRRHLQYFRALQGLAEFPRVRCNAPEFSAVIDTAGKVQPCFFIPGTDDAVLPADPATAGSDLEDALNSPGLSALRGQIRAGGRDECRTCVCSLWRDPSQRLAPFRHTRAAVTA
jgi:Fe-coproporphyrin III synthase